MKREDFKEITDEHFKICEKFVRTESCYGIACKDCPFSSNNVVNGKSCYGNLVFTRAGIVVELAKEFLKFKPSRLADAEEKHDAVNKPNHYQLESNGQKLEVKDLIKAVVKDMDGTKGYYVGNVIKYVLRAEKKNRLEDYKKAKRYLEFIIDECDE